jgi:hypothetical protein
VSFYLDGKRLGNNTQRLNGSAVFKKSLEIQLLDTSFTGDSILGWFHLYDPVAVDSVNPVQSNVEGFQTESSGIVKLLGFETGYNSQRRDLRTGSRRGYTGSTNDYVIQAGPSGTTAGSSDELCRLIPAPSNTNTAIASYTFAVEYDKVFQNPTLLKEVDAVSAKSAFNQCETMATCKAFTVNTVSNKASLYQNITGIPVSSPTSSGSLSVIMPGRSDLIEQKRAAAVSAITLYQSLLTTVGSRIADAPRKVEEMTKDLEQAKQTNSAVCLDGFIEKYKL